MEERNCSPGIPLMLKFQLSLLKVCMHENRVQGKKSSIRWVTLMIHRRKFHPYQAENNSWKPGDVSGPLLGLSYSTSLVNGQVQTLSHNQGIINPQIAKSWIGGVIKAKRAVSQSFEESWIGDERRYDEYQVWLQISIDCRSQMRIIKHHLLTSLQEQWDKA